MVILAYLLAEGFAFAFVTILNQRPFSHGDYEFERSDIIHELSGHDPRQEYIRNYERDRRYQLVPTKHHPYVGFVDKQKHHPGGASHFATGAEYDPYGFFNKIDPIQKKAPGKFIIGFLGGSVGEIFFNEGRKKVAEELKKHPAYQDKELVLIKLAMGGYKQPQQLMAVNYIMSLGGEFDMLINLDGLNELALPVTEFSSNAVHPSYPREWFRRSLYFSSRKIMQDIGKVTLTREIKEKWARFFSQVPLTYSPVANLIWKAGNQTFDHWIFQLNMDLMQQRWNQDGNIETGPAFDYSDTEHLYEYLRDLWKQSSLLLHRIAKANGTRYYHFIQPNQYVPGSKSMGPEEKKVAWQDNHPFRKVVLKGYPMLLEAGQELKAEGVSFYDMTMVFKDVEDKLFSDSCCHFGYKGNQILARAVAKIILSEEPDREPKTSSVSPVAA